MRLHEIAQINEVTAFQERKLMDNDWKNPREVMNWLRSKNFEKKGSGQFSSAFVHPGYKRIVKISKKQDECWLRFAHWTLRMTSHPNVPYIDWVRRYGEDDKFFIAVVEKLAPFNRQAIMNTIDLPGLAYLYLREDWFQGDRNIERRFIKEGIIYNEEAAFIPQVRRYLQNAKSGKRFINVIRSSKGFAKGKCAYDMHDGNLMYRPSDRRLVVIDPLADLNQAVWF
jgi:hypothetical protein